MFNRRKRMAQRYLRRTKISGEEAVTISFGFSSLAIAIVAALVEEVPYVGFLLGLVFFRWHRTVLVTDRHAYVYRDLPFHQPGARLGEYPLGPNTVSRVRGKLTFSDGLVVWHSPLFAWRQKQVAEAIHAAHSSASARDGTSTTENPPTYAFPSRNAPAATFPSVPTTSTDSGGNSPPPNTHTPASIASRTTACAAADTSGSSSPGNVIAPSSNEIRYRATSSLLVGLRLLPQPVDRPGVERNPASDERAARPRCRRREEGAERDLVELVARKRCRLGSSDENRSRQELPAGALVEPAQRGVAGEQPDVGTARRDLVAGCADQTASVSTSPQLLVGDDGAQPARGPLSSVDEDRLREDVQCGADALAVEQQHRDRLEERVVNGPDLERLVGRPRLLLEPQHLGSQLGRHLVLREAGDPHAFTVLRRRRTPRLRSRPVGSRVQSASTSTFGPCLSSKRSRTPEASRRSRASFAYSRLSNSR